MSLAMSLMSPSSSMSSDGVERLGECPAFAQRVVWVVWAVLREVLDKYQVSFALFQEVLKILLRDDLCLKWCTRQVPVRTQGLACSSTDLQNQPKHQEKTKKCKKMQKVCGPSSSEFPPSTSQWLLPFFLPPRHFQQWAMLLCAWHICELTATEQEILGSAVAVQRQQPFLFQQTCQVWWILIQASGIAFISKMAVCISWGCIDGILSPEKKNRSGTH